MQEYPENILEMVNQRLGGFNRIIGLSFVKVTPDELIATLDIVESHTQPYGLVHGGVYAGMIESVCSTGAALSVFSEGKSAVGLENATSFLRAVRLGNLRCSAKPLAQGRHSQVWEAEVHDDRDRLVATGRVRLLVLEAGVSVDGKPATLPET